MENKKPEDLKQDLTAPAELDDEKLAKVAAGKSEGESEQDLGTCEYGDLLRPIIKKK